MKVIYRISECGNPKIKPDFVTPRNIFVHFTKVFKESDIYVIADNITDETHAFLQNYISADKITRTSLGNSASFLYSVQFAIESFADDERVYFAEDDYIYRADAPQIITEGLDIADYSSGYDHPDKYINHSEGGPNPYISEGGEMTCVLISKSRHWKITNSCCMTFATRVKTLKEDLPIYAKYCQGRIPNDFHMFLALGQKQRKLVSCIPSVSTHGEIHWLAPFLDWTAEYLRV